MIKLFKKTPDKVKAKGSTQTQVVSSKLKSRPQPFADQTIDYLKAADPDDVLELMLPRLVIEQQNRLASTAKELEEIDRKLAKLYASRDDVYSVMAQNQSNGVADF
jgi:acyl transferase domain-containing protein